MSEKIIGVLFNLILFGFLIGSFLFKDQLISITERRKLTTITALKEDVHKNLEDYLADQFPFREQFLTLDNIYNRYILQNKGYQNVVVQEDYLVEQLYPLDEKSVDHFIRGIQSIEKKYLKESRTFYSIIPDKSYFLQDNKFLKIDYQYLLQELEEKLNIPYIDALSFLELTDYYKNDIHLKQPAYLKIIEELAKYLDFPYTEIQYKESIFPNFKGSSFYKIPFREEEQLVYLENEIINQAKVKHLEYKEDKVYNREELDSIDPYNVFLRGPSSLIEIENPTALNDKELILFRDSFGSSLAPLLIPFYKKITLIDLRYINIEQASNYVDFKNKDVLFFYSTLSINNSYTLKFIG